MNLKISSAAQCLVRSSKSLYKLAPSHSTSAREMEGMDHFSHEHPLVLSKYNHSPADALCRVCNDPILMNTNVYHCIHRSISTQDSACARFFLHKTCAHLPLIIQHHSHMEHLLTLKSQCSYAKCQICHVWLWPRFVYVCTMNCYKFYAICLKCAYLERELNHPSHNHTLTLLPLKALHICGACGREGSSDYSYLCQTCFFWIHKSCASAPAHLVREDHHHDHPLVLAYSLPEEYKRFGVSCSLCPEKVSSFYWLYFCAGCRYFAHVQCALSEPLFAKDGKDNDIEGDVEGLNLVHFPASENEPYFLYQLIQQFAKNYSISTDEKSENADKISQCRNGHSLILYDDFNNKNVVETDTSDKRICDGCVQPLSSPPDPYYGCLDCNFFLHSLCAAELPGEIQHASQPYKKLTRSTRCYQTSKKFNFYKCDLCDKYCNGILYSDEPDRSSHQFGAAMSSIFKHVRHKHRFSHCDESCSSAKYITTYSKKAYAKCVDVVCAALPSKIKHDSHKHTLHQQLIIDAWSKKCRGCGLDILGSCFGCKICDDYHIDIKCALKKGEIKHRWDEHKLFLMYPPVKDHPHDFNCELCSEDINPNFWFYFCHKCDTSFHTICADQDEYSNIKYGGLFKDYNLHQHSLQLTGTREDFKCGNCGKEKFEYYRSVGLLKGEPRLKWEPCLKCVSCKFSVCVTCIMETQKNDFWEEKLDQRRWLS